MMTWLCFATCFFGWGVAVFLMTLVSRSLNLSTILAYNLIGYVLVNLFFFNQTKLGWTLNHGLAVLIGALFVLSNLAYYKLSEMGGQASILAPLTSLYVVVTVVLGMVFLREPPTLRKWVGIGLAVVAIYLLSGSGATTADSGGMAPEAGQQAPTQSAQ